MKAILKYLRDPKSSSELLSDDVDETLATASYNKFSKETDRTWDSNISDPLPHLKPNPGIGQIWICRQEYVDRNNSTIKGIIPYYVLIVDKPSIWGDLNFVRIHPISMFTEFKADDDRLVEDESITGFKFLIETWNEQPIDVSLLRDFIGSIDIKKPSDDQEITLTVDQKEFRKIEINNTSYLRQSVVSYIESKERIVVRKRVVASLLMAAILIGFAYIIWQPFKTGNIQIFEKYAVAYPSKSVLGFTGETRNTLGDTCIMEGFSFEECLRVDTALRLYDMGEFSKSMGLLNEILEQKEENTDLKFYLAISQLKSDEVNASIKNLELLSEEEDYRYTDEAKYYLALAYIKEGKQRKARKILYELEESKSKYSGNAREILDQMRWF